MPHESLASCESLGSGPGSAVAIMPFDRPSRSGEARPSRRWHSASWSECVVDASVDRPASDGSLGLRFRGAVAGPEQVLVEDFLQATNTSLAPGRNLTVFVQPAIETGFPDLVAVVWRSDVARKWVAERRHLRASDLRLLHLLATRGPMPLARLREVFQRGLHGMLTRLEEAAVVAVGKSDCRAQKTANIFAVERIIAIEAKVTASKRALEQASTNVWFSSESHALVPKSRPDSHFRDAASALGIGVIAFDKEHQEQVFDASVRSVPQSYGLWLFNEWTWRVSQESLPA